MTVSEAITLFKTDKSVAFICKDEAGKINGVLTPTVLMGKVNKLKVTMADPIKSCLLLMKNIRMMTSTVPVFELSRVLERDNFVIVEDKYVVTSNDVLDFM